MTEELQQEIIREVIEELINRGFVLPTARNLLASEDSNDNPSAAVDEKPEVSQEKSAPPMDFGQVLTEEKVDRAAASRGRITISSSVVITDLARERAKKLGLEIIVK
jgi:hypothetical protein